MGCTIGATILEAGREFLLFKNKDLPRAAFSDRLVVEPAVFGVRGLHIPAGDGGGEDVLSGFSIGANAHGVCACNSHVRSLEGAENYDLLTEAAVRGTADVAEAVEKVRELAGTARCNWSNILIADPNGAVVVEIADEVAQSAPAPVVARANEHLLAHGETGAGAPSVRARVALAATRRATAPADVMQLCGSHEREAERANLCAHGGDGKRNTVYSYILHWKRGELTLFVAHGHPCDAAYHRIPLRFPLDTDTVAAAYPR